MIKHSQKSLWTGVAFCAAVMMYVCVPSRSGRLNTAGRLDLLPLRSVAGALGLVVE